MRKIILNGKEVYCETCNIPGTHKYELLKKLANDVFGFDIQVQKINNKPIISNNTALFCSLSDSGNTVFVALCDGSKVGIDVEFLKPRKKELLTYSSNEQEINQFNKTHPDLENKETIIWSIKESVQKCDSYIYSPDQYTLKMKEGQISIHRAQNRWVNTFWIEQGYVFSVSIKVL